MDVNPSNSKWNDVLSKLKVLNNLHLSYEYGKFCNKVLRNSTIRLIVSHNDTLSILQAFPSTSKLLAINSIDIGGMDGSGFAISSRAPSTTIFLMINELNNHLRKSLKGLKMFNCKLHDENHKKYGGYLVRMGYEVTGKSYTAILDLSKGKESIWRYMNKKFRNAVRQGKKRGVTIKEALSKEDLYQFYLIKKSYKYLGESPLSRWSTFETRIELALDMRLMKVFIAMLKEEVAAAAAIWTYGHSLGYAIGALNRNFQWYRPMNLLQWHIIEWAIQNGYKRYNLWGLNPSQHSLNRFKLALGARIQANFNYMKVDLKGFNATSLLPSLKRVFPTLHNILHPLLR